LSQLSYGCRSLGNIPHYDAAETGRAIDLLHAVAGPLNGWAYLELSIAPRTDQRNIVLIEYLADQPSLVGRVHCWSIAVFFGRDASLGAMLER
jgi:hypothetical protein